MDKRHRRPHSSRSEGRGSVQRQVPAPGKRTLASRVSAIQTKPQPPGAIEPAARSHEMVGPGFGSPIPPVDELRTVAQDDSSAAAAAATASVSDAGGALPHADRIQSSFGHHDVSGVRAFVGGEAGEQARAMGATAFATGDAVAFAAQPGLHTAAHEAAHVVQQRAGVVALKGINPSDSVHEQHADAVADAVVAGQSAEALLDAMPSGGALAPTDSAIQRADDAATPYTKADAIEQARLALRAASHEAKRGLADGAGQSSVEMKHFIYSSAAEAVGKHVELALNVGQPEKYAGEAAMAVESINKLLDATAGVLDDEDRSRMDLRAYADALGEGVLPAGRGSGEKASKQPKPFSAGDRKKAIVLALRAARDASDAGVDAVMGGVGPLESAPGADRTVQQVAYALQLMAGEPGVDREQLRDLVDTASRSVGRLIAAAEHRLADNVTGVGVAAQRPTRSPPDQSQIDNGWVLETTTTVSRIRELVGLPGGGWIGEVANGEVLSPDGKPPDKTAAQEALLQWDGAATESIDLIRQWCTGNWIDFCGMTSQNPRLSWDPNVLHQTLSSLIGNGVTQVGESFIRKGSAAAAAALLGSGAGPAGTLIGFVIGVMVETVASLIYDSILSDGGDEAAANLSRRATDLAGSKHDEFSAIAAIGHREQQQAFEVAQRSLNEAATQAKVDAIGAQARAERQKAKPTRKPTDRSLYKQMLRDWVLEHAGDNEKANKQTSPSQWEAAAKVAFNSEEADLDNHPEIFAYQCRAEWRRAGFNPAEVDAYIAEMMAEIAATRARAAMSEAGKMLKAKYDGRELAFHGIAQESGYLTYFHKPDEGIELNEQGKLAIQRSHSAVVTRCKLDLSEANGACYVDRWLYDITFVNGTQGFSRKGFDIARTNRAAYQNSPSR